MIFDINPIVFNVVFGAMILAVTSSVVGSFAFLQKKTLVGDAISHAILPGVCLAYVFTETKNPAILLAGAFASGWLGSVTINFISSRSRIKNDTAISIVLSLFFGIGMSLMSYIQNNPKYIDKSGLGHYLFGSITSITSQDLILFSIVASITLAIIYLMYKELKIVSFDPDFSQSIGFNVKIINQLITILTVISIVLGIKAVGVVLMAGMIITPAAVARFWTNRLSKLLRIAVTVAIFSCLIGSYISYITPTPTGPWIVIIMSFIAIVSFFFAPKKGIVSRKIKQVRFKRKILDENILKAIYHNLEVKKDFNKDLNFEDIMITRSFLKPQLILGLKRLVKQGFLELNQGMYTFTDIGLTKGKRTTKLHRLWELYLTNYMNIAADHVHEDAETIEHILTPELETKLEALLEYPKIDPHNSVIPYND